MRKRIVINLDSPEGAVAQRRRGARSKTRRWPRILAIIVGLFLIVLVAMAAGGFLWWRHYQSTPAYTLALILDAAQRNDVDEFQKRIDDEEIANNMVATVSQKAAGRYGVALSSSVQQRIDSVVPTRLPALKQTINDEILKAMRNFALAPEQRSFISIVGAVSSLLTITTEGDNAKATGAMAGHTIELTMRRDANRWKVIEVKDDVIVQRVVDSVMKELPAIGGVDPSSFLVKKPSRANRPRRRR